MQDLDKFKNEMNLSGKNVYVGHRYVPKIMGDWDNTQIYEPLSIVQYQGNSFTSRQFVPSGVELTNEEYWASTGNYNAQVEYYRQDVRNLETNVNNLNDEVISARNGEANLGDRLDKEQQEVATQLAQSGLNALTNGFVNDGNVDNSEALINLNDVAENNKLFFPNGTYKLNTTQPIDLNFSGFDGNDVTIDLSESTAVPTFRVKGSRELIVGGLTLKKGDCKIPNVSGDFKKGDVIIITSNQPLPTYSQSPTNRPFYQGERHTVDKYNSVTKELRITGHFEFDYSMGYSGAYLYKVNQKRFTLPKGIKFVGTEGGHQRLFELIYTEFDINSVFTQFGESSVKTFASVGKFNGSIYGGYQEGSTTAYGIQVCDLSSVSISAHIYGAKHCVSGGGGGYYKTNDFGVEGYAVYPAKYTITGGEYVNTNEEVGSLNTYPAIDAHGNMKEVIITGAIIHGGVKLNADYSLATGNVISMFDSPAILGVEVESATDDTNWGSLKLANNVIHVISSLENPATRPFASIKGKYRSVVINDNEVHGNFKDGIPPIDISVDAQSLEIENNTIDITSNHQMIIVTGGEIHFNNNIISGVATYIVPLKEGVIAHFNRNIIRRSKLFGAYLNGSNFNFEKILAKDNNISDSNQSGLKVVGAKRLVSQQNDILSNGKDIAKGVTSRCGLEAREVAELVLDKNDFRDLLSSPTQVYGVYHTAHSTIETRVLWSDNIMEGVESSTGYILAGAIKRQRGNKGNNVIPDYIENSDGNMYKMTGTSWVLVE